jgi:hypothetical protein
LQGRAHGRLDISLRVLRREAETESTSCRRTVDITAAQLDALEERGYLDPHLRGDRADKCEAIETFLRIRWQDVDRIG